MMNPQVEEAKSSVDMFELPCGYLDPEGNLHTDIEVREMTGEEEEILAAKNMPVIKKLNKILARCTVAIGSFRDQSDIERIIPDLTQGDRVYLLFAIRRVSLGDDMPLFVKCPQCEQESHVTIDLSDLEVKKMADPKIRVYTETLPKTKKKVVLKVLSGRGEEAISKAATTGKDLISYAILTRIETMDGKPASIRDLKALPLADRNFLRDVWEDHEGGINTELTVACAQCDHEFDTNMSVGDPGFFNPLAALKNWKKKSSS